MFKRFLAWIKSLFQKPQNSPQAPQPADPVLPPPSKPESPVGVPEPFAGTPRPVVIADWAGKPVSALIMFMGRGLSKQEEEIARKAGVYFGESAPTIPAPDRSGFDLGTGGGNVKVNPVEAGKFYTYTFLVSERTTEVEFQAFGAPGRFFTSITDYVTGPDAEIIAPTLVSGVGISHRRMVNVPRPGSYQYHVNVSGSGDLGVQYVQR